MNENNTITIFGLEESEDRGLFDRLQDLRYGHGEVDAETLKERLGRFLQTMQELIQSVPGKLGEFTLDTITLTVEVSASGQVSLLGTGGQVAGKGGLTFTLKRPTEASEEK
jgi:hypothetical protein